MLRFLQAYGRALEPGWVERFAAAYRFLCTKHSYYHDAGTDTEHPFHAMISAMTFEEFAVAVIERRLPFRDHVFDPQWIHVCDADTGRLAIFFFAYLARYLFGFSCGDIGFRTHFRRRTPVRSSAAE